MEKSGNSVFSLVPPPSHTLVFLQPEALHSCVCQSNTDGKKKKRKKLKYLCTLTRGQIQTVCIKLSVKGTHRNESSVVNNPVSFKTKKRERRGEKSRCLSTCRKRAEMEEERCRHCEKVNKSHTSAPMELKVGERKSKQARNE